MADFKDRVHKRFPFELAVEISAKDWEDVLHLTTDNISQGGLFIRTDEPPDVGSRLQITLQLPDGGELVVDGVVVHSITFERAWEGLAAGFGVRFDSKHDMDLGLLEAMAVAQAGDLQADDEAEAYVSVPARLTSPDGSPAQVASAHRLLQLSAVRALAEQARDDGTYEIDLPDGAIIDLPPPPEAISEVEEADHRATPRPEPPKAAPTVAAEGQAVVFGIDFGTTYSSIAMVRGQNIAILEDEEGITMFPSSVCYPDDGSTLVGWSAREQAPLNPATTFRSPKRLIGRRHDDQRIEALLASSPLRTSAGPNGEVVADVHGETITIPQVCAEIIRYVAAIGSAGAKTTVERIVLSVPTSFEEERHAIKRAAELAGLTVVGIVDEPVAAAMAYGLGRQDQTVAVYDFGGGTFDFSVMAIKKGRFEMLGESGDPWLGGDDFDLALANHVADLFWRRTKVDLRQRQVEWQRLLFHCEAAKRRLSSEEEVLLSAPAMLMSLKGPVDLELTISREQCHALWSDLVGQSLDAVEGCLSLASMGPGDVDAVVMTGGVSRIPLVQQRVQELFQQQIELTVNPEHAVVMGNAICGRFVSLSGRLPV